MSTWFNYTATLKILVFSLVVGAGLPALFAVGIRLSAVGAGVSGGGHAVAVRRPVVTVLSWAIFALVLAAVVLGVLFIAREFIAHHTGWYILGAPRPHNAK
ncbi:hypothetical protein [Mycobacterium noviomagense]|uniref:Transmembrane protein n=1 Tax=Mycobacterium noviomagense TaxID=459858 RepID=A0A7I7PET1_9MYCO|nr:hypothetical protein [Mycobacterium noviomagense]ORB11751.1 hypothetical protein BST37_18410 [Mycobacterium noviomagense]BBY07035.1 hypothetical protein MNVI_23530 [Mycobacterium noviomagense]